MDTPQLQLQGLKSNSMAGSAEIDYASALDYRKTLPNLKTNDFCFDIDLGSESSGNTVKDKISRHLILTDLLKASREKDFSRPLLPPMLGNGESVDLLKLYSVVREKGNYESVNENGSWGLVAEELGFSSCAGSTLKLIYLKYLVKMGLWSQKIVNEKNLRDAIENIMKVDADFSVVVSDVSFPKKMDEGSPNPERDKIDVDNSCESSIDLVDEGFNRKRKREGYEKMLSWITMVARDPCDPELGSLPERTKWKSYGEEQMWKQVLIARETMILKSNVHSVADQSSANFWKRPMHPSMYEDPERVRSSRRVIPSKELSSKTRAPSESSSGTSSDLDDEFGMKNEYSSATSVIFFLGDNKNRKGVPIGPHFQAHVPEWKKENYESDSKWTGSRVWPLESGEKKKHLVERERMGKGRQDSCGCQYLGSIECVRFHIAEKRNRIILELGSAFYRWKFDKMGEEVALSWTKKEEEKFQGVIRSNPPSLEKCFWDEIVKAFPDKKREELVSYYFNVFLLHRRIYQNRSTPRNIDSDDEESEFKLLSDSFRHQTGKSPSSIFYSPKKAHS